jgi:sec-independent protein translocase protein TatC
MKTFFYSVMRLVTAPFRFIRWAFHNIFSWTSSIVFDIKAFFKEEPEDAPLGETLAKTINAPEGLLDHINDLRKHLFRAVIFYLLMTAFAFIFSRRILEILAEPLPGGADSLIAIDITEPLSTLMRISLLVGFVLALPYIIFEVFRFIAPGISTKARIWGLLGIPIVVIFFIGGMAFAYFIMLRRALEFLTGGILGLETEPRPSSYIGFITNLLFWVGMAFQFPLVIFVLAGMGIIYSETLIKHWRVAIIIIAIAAAIITPTIDPLNMALIMGPLIALYFISILLAKIAQRPKK